MRKNLSRITLTELRPIMGFFHSQFPEWRVLRKDKLVREASPVLQGISFERLSYGAYRPVGHVRVLVAPRDHWAFELSQDLNVKLRTIDRRRHESVKEQVASAMRAEFVPSIDRPLIAEEVLDLYEADALPTTSEAYSLAPLNAYLGHFDRAKYWCGRFKELIGAQGRLPHELDAGRLAFLDQLETWIERGDAKEQLERVLQEERRKWGLTEA